MDPKAVQVDSIVRNFNNLSNYNEITDYRDLLECYRSIVVKALR